MSANTTSHACLRRLCDDIQSLESGVHADIVKHLDEKLLTRNANGVFFDIASVSEDTLNKIRDIVTYAKGMRTRLAEHDREMFESSQRLVSGPVDTVTDERPLCEGVMDVRRGEGEEAFCVRMEHGCVSKPAKNVFLRK